MTQAAPHTFANGDEVYLEFAVPITNWTSSAILTNSQTFRIAPLLASGTRVTGSAPAALGEYRSYRREAGANTYTETNGDPTASPTSANGVRLYGGTAYASADPNNEPSRYDIFVGKNKHIETRFFPDAGLTGHIQTAPHAIGTSSYGCTSHYDSVTGVVSVWIYAPSGSTSASYAGVSQSVVAQANAYFDIIVSEKVLPFVVETL